MTTKNAETQKCEKPKKKNKLRYNEYYDIQDEFDRLYELSQKGQHFKHLLELVLDERNIELAYRTIKRNTGSKTAGVNGTTIEDWEIKTPEQYVKYVRSRLADYKPQPVRRVEIPKPNGTKRPLGIPTIEDRLIQQCIKQVLEPICEAKFYAHNYGFRPNRSTHHAIAMLNKHVNMGHLYYVVDVDIKGFFDNVDHGKLLKQMWTMGIRDKNLLCIISKMLKAEIDGIGVPTKGTPQGGILSPLLSNIVLNELDWWIAGQWETFETKKKYYSNPNLVTDNSSKYATLRRTSKLKEIYIIRYADDFKILCRTKKSAWDIYYATQKWLDERLHLKISPEKSKIVDLRRTSSEFLGLKFKAKAKGKVTRRVDAYNPRNKEMITEKKYVLLSQVTDKSEARIVETLQKRIRQIQKHPTVATVNKYNSAVLGIQNYYSIATHVNVSFNKIAYKVSKTLWNRTRDISSANGTLSKTYQKLYKGNYKKIFVAGTALFPIADIQHKSRMCFSQQICDYTKEGRALIHDNRKGLDMATLRYLMNNPVNNESIEYNDNRISLYSGQNGKCGISGEPLLIGKMEVHHRKPRHLGGTDRYQNLILITYEVHKLIHATTPETINKYRELISLDKENLEKLNKLRIKVGNPIIQ